MSNARNLADLLDSTGDVKSDALDNVSGLPDAIDVNASAPADSLNVNSVGNIGIGTTPENWASNFNAIDIGTGGALVGTDASNYTSYACNSYRDSSGWKYKANQKASLIGQNDGIFSFYNAVSGTQDTAITWSERMRIDSSGNLKYNSGFGSVGTAYGCRAWVSIQSYNSPATVGGSGNVSSVSDLNSGYFKVNFSNSFPDIWYAFTSGFQRSGTSEFVQGGFARTTSYEHIESFSGGTRTDINQIYCAWFR